MWVKIIIIDCMSEEIKPIKSERIDNPDGSYILKELYDENPDGFLSAIIYFDKNNRLVKIEEFYDNEFKELFITETRKYDIFNNWVSVVVEENYTIWQKRYYKKGNLVKEKSYDKESNKLLWVDKFEYLKNGHYKQYRKSYSFTSVSFEREYDEKNQKIFNKSSINDGKWSKYFYKYENGKLVRKDFEDGYEEYIYDDKDRMVEIKRHIKNEETYEKKEYQEDGSFIEYKVYPLGYSATTYYDTLGKAMRWELFKDKNFKELSSLSTEEKGENNETIRYTKYVSSDKNNPIKSVKTIIDKDIFTTFSYTDTNYQNLYMKQVHSGNDFAFIDTFQAEYPCNYSFPNSEYKISTEWTSAKSKFEINFQKTSYIECFYSDKKFQDLVCHSQQKFLKDGYTCLFYNVYPKENFVEVQKYKDKTLIYEKQYKKFKFLAKIRFYLGI